MANFVLFCSSLGLGLVHMSAIVVFGVPIVLGLSLVAGVFASLATHATSAKWAKWIYLAAMSVGFFVDLAYFDVLYSASAFWGFYSLLMVAVLLYVAAHTLLHLQVVAKRWTDLMCYLSLVCQTVMHVWVIMTVEKTCCEFQRSAEKSIFCV